MIWVTDMMGKLLDQLVGLVGGSSLLVLAIVAVFTAVWALLLFKAVTPQRQLTAVRDRLIGHIYELGLYQDHLSVVRRIQGDLARANGRYLMLSLPALVVLTIPMIFTLTQLDSLYKFRPFRSGEVTVLSVTLAPETAAALDRLTLDVPAGVTLEAGPVRDQAGRSVAWRLRAEEEGIHTLRILDGAAEFGSRDLVVGKELVRLGQTSNKDWWNAVARPGARPLRGDAPLDELTLFLPERNSDSLSLGLPWWLVFFVFAMLAGLALKDVLRVSI
jgi:hypothetical protein